MHFKRNTANIISSDRQMGSIDEEIMNLIYENKENAIASFVQQYADENNVSFDFALYFITNYMDITTDIKQEDDFKYTVSVTGKLKPIDEIVNTNIIPLEDFLKELHPNDRFVFNSILDIVDTKTNQVYEVNISHRQELCDLLNQLNDENVALKKSLYNNYKENENGENC